jgi:hypothetical protein
MTVKELKSLIRVWGAHVAQEWYDGAETEADEAIKLIDELAANLRAALLDKGVNERSDAA